MIIFIISHSFVFPSKYSLCFLFLLSLLNFQIIIEENRARGVQIIKDGKKVTVKAAREVIVSAGAVESPKILMLSGIGPKSQLEKFEVCENRIG